MYLLFSGLWKHHLTVIKLTISLKTQDAYAEYYSYPYADYHYAVCCVVPEKVITQGRKQKILFATDHITLDIFIHFDKTLLAPKYLGVSSLEVLRPFLFLIQLFNQMLHPLIFLIRFSDRIKPYFPVYKLAFQILINTYELDFVASTSFTI
jgi:hypothetical protein